MLNIKERILQIAKNKRIKQSDFFVEIGTTRGNFTGEQKQSAVRSDLLGRILLKYPDVNSRWLLTGEGEMLKEDNVGQLSFYGAGYPLVEQYAIAGFGNADFMIKEEDVKAYYVVPKFEHTSIDFMIEVRGSSMYPKYNSGDVIACKIIRESQFIQWNKVHVIATQEQGLLVKRLKPGTTADTYIAESDNKEYPSFEVPRNEINGIALVVGVIRLE